MLCGTNSKILKLGVSETYLVTFSPINDGQCHGRFLHVGSGKMVVMNLLNNKNVDWAFQTLSLVFSRPIFFDGCALFLIARKIKYFRFTTNEANPQVEKKKNLTVS